MRTNQATLLLVLLFFPGLSHTFRAQSPLNYPKTAKTDTVDNYFGTKVADPYRWLEDDRSAKTGEWVKTQNAFTQDYFSKIGQRENTHKRLTELWNFNKQSAPFKKGNSFFCFRNNGLQNQSVLYIMKSMEDQGKIALDPNALSSDGTVSLSGISVSKDGSKLAYGISKAGSDWVEIHFKDLNTNTDLVDVIQWVKFSAYSWKGDGIYYSRYNAPTGSGLSQKNQFHKVYYHKLGTDQSEDELIYEDREHANYNFGVQISDDENYMVLYISESTSGEQLKIKNIRENGDWKTISSTFDSEYSVVDNIGSTIYVRTNDKAPNYRLIAFDFKSPEKTNWKNILPETEHLLEGVSFCNSKILANYLKNVSSALSVHALDGTLLKSIPLAGLCRINSIQTDKDYTFATYSTVQFTSPEQGFYLDATTWSSKLIFQPDCKFSSADYTTEQVFYTSKDGTKIPMFITYKKGIKRDGNNPCFVFGYGGFNISIAPEFRIDRTLFLEKGGIYCVPNIRGGGEYGEKWHKAGTKCKKQNVFDDFIAAVEYLVKEKYTSYEKVAIHGRSNGGLLIGAVMTQRPDICKVALPTVGVLDMLRFHLFTIGRAWTVDYGCSDNKEEFACLYKYSPLHNIKKTNYPATLILTGDHDDRVVPAHSFKFAASLQENTTGKEPVLIRIDVNAGHGAGKPTSKQIAEFADMWSFVFYNLDMK